VMRGDPGRSRRAAAVEAPRPHEGTPSDSALSGPGARAVRRRSDWSRSASTGGLDEKALHPRSARLVPTIPASPSPTGARSRFAWPMLVAQSSRTAAQCTVETWLPRGQHAEASRSTRRVTDVERNAPQPTVLPCRIVGQSRAGRGNARSQNMCGMVSRERLSTEGKHHTQDPPEAGECARARGASPAPRPRSSSRL
jgi:hypothetical protein